MLGPSGVEMGGRAELSTECMPTCGANMFPLVYLFVVGALNGGARDPEASVVESVDAFCSDTVGNRAARACEASLPLRSADRLSRDAASEPPEPELWPGRSPCSDGVC